MAPCAVTPIRSLKGTVSFPGDKSIAHRAAILSALSSGSTRIENFPLNKDCLATLNALKKLGIKIRHKNNSVSVSGKGLFGLKRPAAPIFVGDSGTTMRLLLGVLAAQPFATKLIAGKSLIQRPMRRVTEPLRKMGAVVQGIRSTVHAKEEYPPITVGGRSLRPITYRMRIASAQVKSALLLAGLYAKGKTTVIEPIPTRDHTERMLGLFGAALKVDRNRIVIQGQRGLVSPGKFYVPGDISSAAFFIVAAAIVPDSRILIRNISLNPSRTGVIYALKRMGAQIKVKSLPPSYFRAGGIPPYMDTAGGKRSKVKGAEPIGEIGISSSDLKGTTVKRKEVPSLIDELPILMVAACFARGKTIFEGAEELRVKETDRIRSMTENLKKMKADIHTLAVKGKEKIVIQGVGRLKGAKVKSFGDHRTAMSMVVAGLAAEGRTQIDDVSCISKSFPDFLRILNVLKA